MIYIVMEESKPVDPVWTVTNPALEPFDSTPFVGRQQEREQIKTGLKTRTLLQVYGQTMVGKRRLSHQAISELLKETSYCLEAKLSNYLEIPCAEVTSWDEFLQLFIEICKLDIGQQMTEHAKRRCIISNLKDRLDLHGTILLLTNCERFVSRKLTCFKTFESFIIDISTSCQNTRVIVTSQYWFSFENKTLDIQVSELNNSDVCSLLQKILPGIDASYYQGVVTECCYGLPPFIFDAASLIRDNYVRSCFTKYIDFTRDDLRYLLNDKMRSARIHGDTQHSKREISDYFPGLTEYLQQKVIDLSIFRGSFGWESVKSVMTSEKGEDLARVKYDMQSLCRNSVVARCGDFSNTRMRIQPIVESYLRNVITDHVTYNDVVRLKFVTFFGNVLTKANSELFVISQDTIYGYLKDDWLNLEQVLREAIHCTENTYDVFLKVAVGANNLLVNCFPSDALNFYETMTDVTAKFGTVKDMALLKAQLGRTITSTRGSDLDKAWGLFNEALEVLDECGSSKALVDLFRDIGYNRYKCGKYHDALSYCTKALETVKDLEVDPSVTNQIIAVRALLAIPRIFLGDYQAAEKLLLETLELAYTYVPYHPAIYSMINNLGVLYERSDQDDDLAMKYYRASLIERRKYEKMVPGDLIISLNNVGMQYSKRGKHEQSLELLEEAHRICTRMDTLDFNHGLSLWHMGRVNMLLGRFDKALGHLKEAIKIYNVCAKYHGVHVHVRLVMSHCFITMKDMKAARACLREALTYGAYFTEQTPKHEHYLLVLGHLIMLVQPDRRLLTDVLNKFILESKRLMSIPSIKEKSESFKTVLANAERCLRKLRTFETPDTSFMSEIHSVCFVCKDVNKVGHCCEHYWMEAMLECEKEAAIKERLVNSIAVQDAICPFQYQAKSKLLKKDPAFILNRYRQYDQNGNDDIDFKNQNEHSRDALAAHTKKVQDMPNQVNMIVNRFGVPSDSVSKLCQSLNKIGSQNTHNNMHHFPSNLDGNHHVLSPPVMFTFPDVNENTENDGQQHANCALEDLTEHDLENNRISREPISIVNLSELNMSKCSSNIILNQLRNFRKESNIDLESNPSADKISEDRGSRNVLGDAVCNSICACGEHSLQDTCSPTWQSSNSTRTPKSSPEPVESDDRS